MQLWDAPQVHWPVADRTIGVVKTVRHRQKNHQRIRRDDGGRKQVMKVTLIETSTNFYVSNLELGSIPPLFIHQLGRSRWLIDSELFQTMTTDGISKGLPYAKIRGRR